MRRDFHFYGVAVVARAAGFNSRDALTIAYASQYVDDATESELLTLTDGEREFAFDPVRTAYDYFGETAWRDWPAQKRVLVPFHFLPPRPWADRPDGRWSFVTAADSVFARALLKRALRERGTRRLCALGIALHTYADTWAHQGFSGREARGENDVENIRRRDPATGRWEHLIMENVIYDTLPQVGHAEAGLYPDLGGASIRLDLPGRQNEERDNPRAYMAAIDRIYVLLAAIPGKATAGNEPAMPAWSELRPKIGELIADSPRQPRGAWRAVSLKAMLGYFNAHLDEICQEWRAQFSGLFTGGVLTYNYNPATWRAQGLRGDTDWARWAGAEWLRRMPLTVQPDFWDSPWVHFHRAALRQRHYVMERLP